MLRRLMMILLGAPLLIGVAVLVMIGLNDTDLLVTIVSRLMIVAIILGIPVIAVRMIFSAGRSRDRRR